MTKKIIYAIARFLAALIMLQTLYFKFSGSPESVYIFKMVGMEPAGRWIVGVLELVAAVLLVIPRATWAGAILGLGLMAGAMSMHLTILGIEVMGDGGYLFLLSLIVFICSVYLIVANKEKIFKEVLPKILGRK